MSEATTKTLSGQNYDDESYLKLRSKLATYPVGQGFCSDDILWKSGTDEYELGVVGLHKEILDFYDYIKPTQEEQTARDFVVLKIKDVVRATWPDCEVDVFGSFKTGLYLPTSDIDMVIFGKWKALPLHTLEQVLSESGISSEITVLDKARVPIVKMTDKETGLRVDISFNMTNSVRAAELIRSYIKRFPSLTYLVFVLKQFLLQRNLNEVWTGGLSSYALILMVVRFLQQTVSPTVNLGTLLLEFFELYGRHFNYSRVAIRVTDGGEYVRKELVLQNMVQSVRPSLLCIEDPLCPGNDVGRRSYQAMSVKHAFEYAYVVLSSAVLPQYQLLHARKDMSILGEVIRISPKTVECRRRIHNYGSRLLGGLASHPGVLAMDQKARIGMSTPVRPINWPNSRVICGFNPGVSLLPTTASFLPLSLQMPAIAHPQPTVSYPSILGNPALVIPSQNIGYLTTGNKELSVPTTNESTGLNSESNASPRSEPTAEQSMTADAKLSDKPVEYTVLAKYFASLSTLMQSDKPNDPANSASKSEASPTTPGDCEDCKRRCLRTQSPITQSSDLPKNIPQCTSASADIDVSQNASADIPTTSSSKEFFTDNMTVNSHTSGRSRKQASKAMRQLSVHISANSREPQLSRFVNMSSPCNLSSYGQKRHAPAAARRTK